MADKEKTIKTPTIPSKIILGYDNDKGRDEWAYPKITELKNGDIIEVKVSINGGPDAVIAEKTIENIPDDPDVYAMVCIDVLPKVLDRRNPSDE